MVFSGSNQEVLDRSDVVLLAVRPGVAAGILRELHFREDHTVLSFIPVIPRPTLPDLKRALDAILERFGEAPVVVDSPLNPGHGHNR